jgi:Mannosyltransferase (PIG-V)
VRSSRLLVTIRLAYLVGTAATLLWAPVRGGPGGNLLLRTFDRWDSAWFHRIVEHGYSTRQSAAFLPVYPLLVRGVAWVVRNDVAAGMLVSLAAAAAAVSVLERIARRHLPPDGARTAVVLFALYPLAFVFTAFYSDALFILFVAVALDAAERGRALVAGIAGALAVDTRLLGLALVPALVVRFWPSWRRLAAVLLIPLALGLWLLYCHLHFGDAFATTHAEERYWHRQSPSPHAYWVELRAWEASFSNLLLHLPAHGPYPDYVVLAVKNLFDLAFLVAAVWLSVLAWRRVGPALALFSWATLALVVGAPTSDEVLVGLPRFLLADIPLFIVLASLLERRPRARELVYAGFAAVGAATAVGFARGVGII